MTWNPNDHQALQWALDTNEGNGQAYHPDLVDGKAVLRSLENHGDVRQPRGKRCYSWAPTPSTQRVELPPEILAVLDTRVGFTFRCMCIPRGSEITSVLLEVQNADLSSRFVIHQRNGTTMRTGSIADGSPTATATAVNLVQGEPHEIIYSCDPGATAARFWVNRVPGTGLDSPSLSGNPTARIGVSGHTSGPWRGEIWDVEFYREVIQTPEDLDGLKPAHELNFQEEWGTNAVDRIGGAHGLIVNATLAELHATSDHVSASAPNDYGWSLGPDGAIIPASASDPTVDAYFGQPIDHAGQTPFPIVTQTPVGTFNGTNEWIRQNDLSTIVNAGQDYSVRIRFRFTGSLAKTTHSSIFHANAYPEGETATLTGIDVAPDGGGGQVVTAGRYGPPPGGGTYSWSAKSAPLTDDQWHTITARFDYLAQTYEAELDGVPMVEPTVYPLCHTNNDFAVIGGSVQGNRTWEGQLAHVQLWSSVQPADTTVDPDAFVVIGAGAGPTVWDVSRQMEYPITATLANFWAQTTDAFPDWCLDYGGRFRGVFQSANSDYVDVSAALASFSVANDWTVALSYRADSNATGTLICADVERTPTDDRFSIEVTSGQQVRWSVRFVDTPYSVASTSDLNDGQFHRVVAAWESATRTQRLWVDGVLQSANNNSVIPNGLGNACIGKLATTATQWHHQGPIQDVAVYDSALTDPADEATANRVHFWEFNDPLGTVIVDSVGGVDGTLVSGDVGLFWQFVPGQTDRSAAADGRPLTLTPDRFGNPASSLVFDAWSAPELAQLAYPAASPPGQLLRNVAPTDQRWRSEQTSLESPGVYPDGQPFADGDDRVFSLPAPIDQNLAQLYAQAIHYVRRGDFANTSAAAILYTVPIQEPIMERNKPNQPVDFQLTRIADGTEAVNLSPLPTVTVKKDAGADVGGNGTVRELSNGGYSYTPTAAETNATQVSFTMRHPDVYTQRQPHFPTTTPDELSKVIKTGERSKHVQNAANSPTDVEVTVSRV